jgi:heme-degrading monooxygenase HmoA
VGQPYTQTTWRVKPGQENEFVRRWTELADWSALQGLTGSAKLFRDLDEPGRFISVGPWESLDVVRRWRSSPGFHERIGRLSEILDHFEPRTLELVVDR